MDCSGSPPATGQVSPIEADLAPQDLSVKSVLTDSNAPLALGSSEPCRRPASDPTSDSRASSLPLSRASSRSRDELVEGGPGDAATGRGQSAEDKPRTSPKKVERQDAAFLAARSNFDVEGGRPGNVGHGTGECRPCKYFAKMAGCEVGKDCDFCHLWHEPGHPRTKYHPCKRTRQRCKKLVTQIRSQATERAEDFDFSKVALPPSIEANSFLRDKVKRKVFEQVEDRRCGLAGHEAEHAALVLAVAPTRAGQLEHFAKPLLVTPDEVGPFEYGRVYRV